MLTEIEPTDERLASARNNDSDDAAGWSRWRAHATTLLESFRIAWRSLRANKLRTALTLVGVVVGVAAVIAVVTIIAGLDRTVADTFSAQGSTVFSLSKRPQIIFSREDAIRYNKRKDVTAEDATAIRRQCNLCWRTGEETSAGAEVKYAEQKSDGVAIRGIALSMFEIDDISVDDGREWTDSESEAGASVGVIGADVAENLFPNRAPEAIIGEEIRIGGRTFLVVGIAERLGNLFGFSRDNFVLIPFTTHQRLFGTRKSISINIQVPTTATLEDAKDQVKQVMRARRGKTLATDADAVQSVGNNADDADDGFSLESEAVFLDLYKKATANIYLVTIGVAAVSLVVGGIVVMNIMLVSVTERTREVGLRKALGAKRMDILTQFLIEALVLTALGGALGVLTGFVLAYALSAALGFPLLFSINSAALGILVSSLVGIISGISPAWKAARLDPIEALRSE